MDEHYDIWPTDAGRCSPGHDAHGGVSFVDSPMDVPPAVPTAPVAAPRRSGPRRVVIAATVIVAVTLLRPWGDATPLDLPAAATPPASSGPAEIAQPATPGDEASPEPSLLPDEIACSPGGWRVVSLDRLGSWTVRSWVPAQAVLAAGPLDPRIGRLTLESPQVLAIGACAPWVTDSAGVTVAGGPARFLRAWRVDAGSATPVDLGTRRTERLPTVATLYRPSDSVATATSPAHWPGGVYVLEVSSPERTIGAGEGWFVSLVVRDPG
jgi:hypothetical protein